MLPVGRAIRNDMDVIELMRPGMEAIGEVRGIHSVTLQQLETPLAVAQLVRESMAEAIMLTGRTDPSLTTAAGYNAARSAVRSRPQAAAQTPAVVLGAMPPVLRIYFGDNFMDGDVLRDIASRDSEWSELVGQVVTHGQASQPPILAVVVRSYMTRLRTALTASDE